MTAIDSGATTLANGLFNNLLNNADITIPAINLDDPLFNQPASTGDLFQTITRLTPEELTTGVVGGSGMFDKLMTSLSAHLKGEYEANRLSGAEYTKAYVGVTAAALQTGAQYLLGRDQAYWTAMLVQRQAQAAEVEAIKARVELAATKVALAKTKIDAFTAEAAFALTKLKIASEDVTYNNLWLTGKLITEQTEVQRGQTMDTRLDGVTTITGAIGKQKALYTQQITSYQRDAETKYAKMLSDAWITQKTIDEGLLPPAQFSNTEMNEVFGTLRANLDLS